MKHRELYYAVTDYTIFDYQKEKFRTWTLGHELRTGGVVVAMEYNLSYQGLDVYIDDGRIIRIFNVKEVVYRPKDAEEESLSDHERAVTGVSVTALN